MLVLSLSSPLGAWEREALPAETPAAAPELRGTPAPFLDLTHPLPRQASGDTPGGPDSSHSPGEILGGVVGLLALCGLVLIVLRRVSRTTSKTPAGTGQGRVIETLLLGLRGELALVEIGGVRVVVGSDRTGLKVIGFPPSPFTDFIEEARDTPAHSPLTDPSRTYTSAAELPPAAPDHSPPVPPRSSSRFPLWEHDRSLSDSSPL